MLRSYDQIHWYMQFHFASIKYVLAIQSSSVYNMNYTETIEYGTRL